MADYGISTWLVQDYSPEEAAARLRANGFEQVEISGADKGLVPAWEHDAPGVVGVFRDFGLDTRSIHCPAAGRKLDSPDGDVRKAAIAANIDYFRKMRRSGVPEIVIHPTGAALYSDVAATAAARKHARESLAILAEHADREGVRMAVENLGRPPRPGSTVAGLLEMIDGLGDHVGLCLDIGHAEQAALDLLCELRTALASGKLFSLHIHDVEASGVDHFVPGTGRIDWGALIPALDAAGFAGGRILELSPYHGDVDDCLRRAGEVRERFRGRGMV